MNEILNIVKQRTNPWIYLSIGCAGSAEQQFPPFFRDLPGHKLCFLIDPYLEEKPACHTVPIEEALFIEIREYFDYNEYTMDGLCAHAMSTGTKLIVQAFTGEDLRHRYPLHRFGPALLDHVLFDFTYSEGDCRVDFNKVHLLLKPDGTFLHPLYSPLATFRYHKEALLRESEARYNLIYQYVLNLYQSFMGRKEERDWYSPEVTLPKLTAICTAYKIAPSTDTVTLLHLLVEFYADLSHVAGDAASVGDIIDLIEMPGQTPGQTPGQAYINAVRVLRNILKEENSAPQ